MYWSRKLDRRWWREGDTMTANASGSMSLSMAGNSESGRARTWKEQRWNEGGQWCAATVTHCHSANNTWQSPDTVLHAAEGGREMTMLSNYCALLFCQQHMTCPMGMHMRHTFIHIVNINDITESWTHGKVYYPKQKYYDETTTPWDCELRMHWQV